MSALREIVYEPLQVRREIHEDLMSYAAGTPVDDPLARMLGSLVAGLGAMPEWLGLTRAEFKALLADHFPGVAAGPFAGCGRRPDPRRADEADELHALLLAHAALPGADGGRLATLLVAGCMGDDHLWQDLGLWSRQDLSGFIQVAFPTLAVKNDRDMKWKKFFYKQLCTQQGVYTCRAPSCAVCADYRACFGPQA